jgi:uncharacterized protein
MTNPIKTWRKQKQTRPLLGKKGTIITWTTIFVSAPEFKEQTPYNVALVQLEDGEKVYGQVVDTKEVKIGQEVESVLRIVKKGSAEDIIEYGMKFKLV